MGIYDSTGGSIRLSTLISSNIVGPFSIAVDWISDKIYLAQKSASRVDAFSMDATNRTNVLTANLFSPTCIALDASRSYLFLADSGNPYNKLHAAKIERVGMDGSNRRVIVKDKLLDPTSLTVDLIKQRIYWLDKKYDHLESCDYFGRRRHIIASGSQFLPHSLSLDVFENTIFYADSTKQVANEIYFRRKLEF